MGFIPLEPMETLETTESLKKRPEWIKCVVVTSLLIAITLSSVAIGILVGYTFCYIENRTTSLVPGNVTHTHSFQVMKIPLHSFELGVKNRTINGASSMLMSKLFGLGPLNILDEAPWFTRPRDVLGGPPM